MTQSEQQDTIEMHGAEITHDEAECAYCGRLVAEVPTVPALADDAAWGALAQEHAEGCEWVATRAHRRSLWAVESKNRLGQWEVEAHGLCSTREEAEANRAELIALGEDWTEANTRVAEQR